MSKYNREDLIAHGIDEDNIIEAIETIYTIQAHFTEPFHCVVFQFYEAPEILRKVCCLNGGDEDWLVVTNFNEEPDWLPYWIAKMDSCESPDVYILGSLGNAIIYVGSHA
jgi:hypothetical protein